ncbi:hypothetical protein JVU11DRAFT_11649 [Chiua virens]|nr:hypothetical protein JVU11DRAFT_11649 [Chiua virens]
MCNPPFYASMEEVAESTEAKGCGPNAVCTGAEKRNGDARRRDLICLAHVCRKFTS